MLAFIVSVTLLVTTLVAGDGICTDGYFMCATGVCIPEQFVCDGVRDCTTGDDEKSCAKSGDGICTDGYFMCATGVCIPEDFVCDGVRDCTTGDDELHCSSRSVISDVDDAMATEGYFMCADGTNIPNSFVCDGVTDCTTGDDERNCHKSGDTICTDGYFMCATGVCIPEDFVCDGVRDCTTGDDETNCHKSESTLSCVPPFEAAGGTCLHMGADSMTWDEGRDYCRALADNSDLATFPTCEQFSSATYWLNINSADDADLWVGAKKASYPNNWRWTSLEELQTGVPMWAYTEGHDDGMDCASMNKLFRHKLSCCVCDKLKEPLCEIKPEARKADSVPLPEPEEILDCPSHTVQVGDGCFEFSATEETFQEATENCMKDGYQLFHPEDCSEFTHMAHYLETTGLDMSYWVGAEDVSGFHEWTWNNGDNIPGGAPFWAYDQPTHALEAAPLKYCGTMDHIVRYYMADDYCDAKHHYICRILPEIH